MKPRPQKLRAGFFIPAVTLRPIALCQHSPTALEGADRQQRTGLPLPKLLRPTLAFCLAALIALTGLALATARGQLVLGGQVLTLCSGGGLVQLTLDENGQPTGESHLCPDLAATAFLSPDLPAPDPALAEQPGTRLVFSAPAIRVAGRCLTGFSARAPPVLSA